MPLLCTMPLFLEVPSVNGELDSTVLYGERTCTTSVHHALLAEWRPPPLPDTPSAESLAECLPVLPGRDVPPPPAAVGERCAEGLRGDVELPPPPPLLLPAVPRGVVAKGAAASEPPPLGVVAPPPPPACGWPRGVVRGRGG